MINNISLTSSKWISHILPIARRAIHVDQMELDSALSQMYSLWVHPSLVTKMSKARKMTKNHYYRDDPAFVVLQIMFLLITTVGFGLALRVGVTSIVLHCIYTATISYFSVALIIATLLWFLINNYFMNSVYYNELRRDVDWLYVFDVHCNAYFVYFTWTSVVSYVFLPFLLRSESFIACVLSNTVFAIGLIGYVYNIFLGFLDLPVLMHQQKLIYPIPVIMCLVIFLTFVAKLNILAWTLQLSWQ